MKTLTTLLLAFLLHFSFFAHEAPKGFPDIVPDAGSSSYRRNLLIVAFDGLDNVVSLGERNLKWLEHINSHRPTGEKLSLTSKDTQRGIPIDAPSEYNPTLIQEKLVVLKPQIP